MPTYKLTKRAVEAVRPGDEYVIVWDSELKGFGCRVSPQGKKTYVLYYRTRTGQQRKPAIGEHGILTADQARDIARKWLAQVAEGKDPSAEMQDKRKQPVFDEFTENYMRDARARLSEKTLAEYQRQLEMHVFPRIGKMKIAAITRQDIQKIHSAMQDRPVAANRTRALLSAMFNYAEAHGLRSEGSNPAKYVKRNKETSRTRYLTPDEWQRLWKAVSQAQAEGVVSASVANAIRLLALTGCRRDEILCLKWSDVDRDGARLNLRESKTGAKTVFLNKAALDLLSALPRDPAGWVIPGRRTGQRMVNLRKPWLLILKRAGIENLHIHDLRHSFASMGVATGLSLTQIGGLLGHTQAKTTHKYTHLMTDPAFEAVNRIGAAIEELVSIGGAEVVDLSKAG